ncbi:MAG TPA: leucyl aminopeptidase [Myxococcota bacterium]|nr:leucyl aminopeptidase [Myxococcota bacterium]
MKVLVETLEPARAAVDLLALPLFGFERGARRPARLAALDRALGGQLEAVFRSGDFRGRKSDSLLLYGRARGGPRRVLLLGLGEAAKLDAEALRQVVGRAVGAAAARGARSVAIPLVTSRRLGTASAARAMAEGAVLSGYRSDAWRTKREEARPPVARVSLRLERASDLRAARAAVELGVAVAESQNVSRRLSNEPPNALTPAALAREARSLAREVGLACRVLEVPELRRRGMGALLAVGQGSSNPPRLVVLEHRPRGRDRATVCLIGKGITFDSGGISIKPAGGMQDMKHDMSGAAAVVGALRAAALLDLPLHVVGILAAAENLPGGGAYRPGDILTSMSGQTIEIQNTDAEGRLVLCDALHYARTQFEPAAMVDLATLTGACVVALGSHASGLFGNHPALSDAIRRAGEASGERMWPMPLLDEHRDEMRSQVADLKNVSGSRDAGASTAAAFLSRFVGDTPWAHLDIAGTAYTSKTGPCQPYGATGVGVRTLVELLQDWPRGGV